MKRLLTNKWFLLAVRLFIGGLFIYAGTGKFIEPLSLADSITTYQIIPQWLVNLTALGLPPLEIIAGFMLVIGWGKRVASFCLLILTLVFCMALIQGLARGLEIDCGCFGSGEPSMTGTIKSLGRDVLLVTGCTLVYHDANHTANSLGV
jgi:uncharacterized membrane protein YphA (DoxX/SURF4 family)